jgi:WD40 repeat protein
MSLGNGVRAGAQTTRLPGADEVKALHVKFHEERARIVKEGIASRFIPALMEKADELAKKSTAALNGGRLLQASEAIRLARWQLPYQPTSIPPHVSRIIGNLRLRHSRNINVVAFSPDGTKLATGSNDYTVKIWDLGNGHELLTYTGHTDRVIALAWTPDGKSIVSGGNKQPIKIWDPATGKDLMTINPTGEYVSAFVLSGDGKHLFTGQANVPAMLPGGPTNGLFVYEMQSGKLAREIRDFTHKIGTLAVSPDGNLLAAGDDTGSIRLFQYPLFVNNANQPAYWTQQDPTGATYHLTFSPDSKTLVRCGPLNIKIYNTPLPGDPFQIAAPAQTIAANDVRCATFSKDGKTLYTGNGAGNIHFWDPATGLPTGAFQNAHTGAVKTLAFNHDGTQLASCAEEYVARLWDFNVVLQSHDLDGHDGPIWAASFSPDGQRIVSAGADKTVKVWQAETGKILFDKTEHNAPVTFARFSPDGKRFASVGGDRMLRIWDADNGKQVHTCAGHQGTITFLDYSTDGKRIVTGGADRRIKIWDADTGKELSGIDDNPSVVAGVVFSPDGRQLAVANIDQTIRLYDAATGKLQHRWYAHGTSVNGVAYSPDGQYLASCGGDMMVLVWPLATPGLNPIRLAGHAGPVSMVAFRKDNLYLISGGADQLIKLWKIEGSAGKEVKTFRGHKDWVTSVAFSKDGYHVVSGSVDRLIKIWEITSREIPQLAEHSNSVEAVAVSPDNKLIASGSVDRTIKLWDLKTGNAVATLTGHPSAIISLTFTPDSKGLLSSGSDGSIHLWQVAPPLEIPRTPAQLTAFKQMQRHSPYIALDPAGKTVFVWLSFDTYTQVDAFDIATGKLLFEFKEDSRKINSMSFCANGQLAATGAKDGSVRIWKMNKNAAEVAPGGDWFLFDKVEVADIALSPDGTMLVATSNEGEIKIAKIAGREVLKTMKGHEGMVLSCMISPDGKRFVTVGKDHIVKAWNLATGAELRRWDLGNHQGQFVMNIAFSADSRQVITANANTTVYVLDLP